MFKNGCTDHTCFKDLLTQRYKGSICFKYVLVGSPNITWTPLWNISELEIWYIFLCHSKTDNLIRAGSSLDRFLKFFLFILHSATFVSFCVGATPSASEVRLYENLCSYTHLYETKKTQSSWKEIWEAVGYSQDEALTTNFFAYHSNIAIRNR